MPQRGPTAAAQMRAAAWPHLQAEQEQMRSGRPQRPIAQIRAQSPHHSRGMLSAPSAFSASGQGDPGTTARCQFLLRVDSAASTASQQTVTTSPKTRCLPTACPSPTLGPCGSDQMPRPQPAADFQSELKPRSARLHVDGRQRESRLRQTPSLISDSKNTQAHNETRQRLEAISKIGSSNRYRPEPRLRRTLGRGRSFLR